LWPTPCASDSSHRKASPNPHLTKNGTLKHIGKSGVLSQIRLSQAVKHFAKPGDTDGPLNPEWTEWLMGWPIGQTALKPLATDKFREWQQQHGGS
jgi:DNA (cytosine-5)-methyltransferase 1